MLQIIYIFQYILLISWQSHHKKIDGLQCEIQWLNIFCTMGTQTIDFFKHTPLLLAHGEPTKYVEGQGHFLML
jgi:hypothetical protein